MMTLGSLFDGSGGFPLAGALSGIRPVWAAEVEPYPIAVTRSRFPMMQHLGSVTEVHGDKVQPVDVITFGSPCQDLSVAGKRAGIHEGQRSNLFFEAIRIIKEMRAATNGRHPTFAVWENVPGAFSSNQGEDFRCVLEEFVKIRGGGTQYLDLTRASGNPPERFWATDTASHGGSSTRNTGECPSVARESTLWQILQADAPEKYYLSARACEGILRRAERRGKALPSMLREALEEAVALGA